MLFANNILQWLLDEHTEKPKLTKKEHMLCEILKTGWIARDKDGLIYHYKEGSYKRRAMWVSGGEENTSMELTYFDVKFEFIRWNDDEPWAVRDLLKLEVEE